MPSHNDRRFSSASAMLSSILAEYGFFAKHGLSQMMSLDAGRLLSSMIPEETMTLPCFSVSFQSVISSWKFNFTVTDLLVNNLMRRSILAVFLFHRPQFMKGQ